jgi:hypothetical protein
MVGTDRGRNIEEVILFIKLLANFFKAFITLQ